MQQMMHQDAPLPLSQKRGYSMVVGLGDWSLSVFEELSR